MYGVLQLDYFKYICFEQLRVSQAQMLDGPYLSLFLPKYAGFVVNQTTFLFELNEWIYEWIYFPVSATVIDSIICISMATVDKRHYT